MTDMRTDGGFVHAWTVRAEIPPDVWGGLHTDVVRVLRAASLELEKGRSPDALAMLRGPNGLGHLAIEADCIAFNGNAFMGQAGDAFSLERIARSGIVSRVGSSGVRRAIRRCDTLGNPYDLAVCAVLLTVLHHDGAGARLGTSGTLRRSWARPAALVRSTLGECGQLVQLENGMLRWADGASSSRGVVRSSAS